jgi:hypothetical protein
MQQCVILLGDGGTREALVLVCSGGGFLWAQVRGMLLPFPPVFNTLAPETDFVTSRFLWSRVGLDLLEGKNSDHWKILLIARGNVHFSFSYVVNARGRQQDQHAPCGVQPDGARSFEATPGCLNVR